MITLYKLKWFQLASNHAPSLIFFSHNLDFYPLCWKQLLDKSISHDFIIIVFWFTSPHILVQCELCIFLSHKRAPWHSSYHTKSSLVQVVPVTVCRPRKIILQLLAQWQRFHWKGYFMIHFPTSNVKYGLENMESINPSINIYSQQFPELYIITFTY